MNPKQVLFIASWILVTYLAPFALLLYNEQLGNWLLDKYSEKPAEARENFHNLLSFFRTNEPAEFPEFNENENSHMEDVRAVISILSYVLLLGIIGMALLWNSRFLRKAPLIAVILPLPFIIIPFDFVFDWFHKVFFPQGNWMFPAGSTITSFYTESFFLAYALWIIGTGWVLNLLIFAYQNFTSARK